MIGSALVTTKLLWIAKKDFVSEWRSRQILPAMLLVGAVIGFVFGFQTSLVPLAAQRIVGGLYWLAVYLGGVVALEGSFASERDASCWQGLLLYPVQPSTIYLAKLLAGAFSLAILQLCLIPLFALMMRVSLWDHPWHLFCLMLIGNLALTSLGTLVAALTAESQQGRGLLLMLGLSLEIPVLLAASEATRLMLEHETGAPWWRWVQLLAAGALIFITAGIVLFEFIVEE
jgi:heme exporter protein B